MAFAPLSYRESLRAQSLSCEWPDQRHETSRGRQRFYIFLSSSERAVRYRSGLDTDECHGVPGVHLTLNQRAQCAPDV